MPLFNCTYVGFLTQEDGGKMLTHITQQHSRSVGGGNIPLNSDGNNKGRNNNIQPSLDNIFCILMLLNKSLRYFNPGFH